MFNLTQLRYYLVVGAFLFLTSLSFSSCSSARNVQGWTDLPHARKLDEMKGKRSKKYQKNVARREKY